jgi:hypothetical protein
MTNSCTPLFQPRTLCAYPLNGSHLNQPDIILINQLLCALENTLWRRRQLMQHVSVSVTAIVLYRLQSFTSEGSTVAEDTMNQDMDRNGTRGSGLEFGRNSLDRHSEVSDGSTVVDETWNRARSSPNRSLWDRSQDPVAGAFDAINRLPPASAAVVEQDQEADEVDQNATPGSEYRTQMIRISTQRSRFLPILTTPNQTYHLN